MIRPSSASRTMPPICVVSWFYDDQPGFLDFRYRIESLVSRFDVTVVLRDRRFATEAGATGARLLIVPSSTNTAGLLRYCVLVARALRRMSGVPVLLLGAQLAPLATLIPRDRVAIYWNEHPTHTYRAETDSGYFKRLRAALLVRAAFQAARRAALVMPIGEAHEDDLRAQGVATSAIRLVYMGVHPRFLRRRPAGASDSSRALRVLYAGTVAPERGRDVMLEGLALARARGFRCTLTLVGASPTEQAYCAARADELGISDMLRVLGRVNGDDLPSFYFEADAGICLWEDRVWWRFNPPTKLFEYLAAGLPVLASRIRTHTRYVEDGVTGLVFDYGPEGFAAVLERLHRARADLPLMSEAAAAAGDRFLWPRVEPAFISALVQTFPALKISATQASSSQPDTTAV